MNQGLSRSVETQSILFDSETLTEDDPPVDPETQEEINRIHALAQKVLAKIAITEKAQRWYRRNMDNRINDIDNYARTIGIFGQKYILGARYAHPKLDGRPTTGQTNYYPPGIEIVVLIENGVPLKADPDSDWKSVPGMADSNDNAFIFLNASGDYSKCVGRHEVGHTSDHIYFHIGTTSTSFDHDVNGLMKPTTDGSVIEFSEHSIIRLRGSNR